MKAISARKVQGHEIEVTLLMLGWAFVFLIIAILAAVTGFGGIASAATGIAKILFFVFLIVFVILLIDPAPVQVCWDP